jgi:hypothetical protein
MEDRFDRRFWLEDPSGVRLYPVRVRDRITGREAFRVSSGGNTKADSREFEDLAEAARLVVRSGHRIRASEGAGKPTSLVGIGGRRKFSWGAVPGFTI